jgi:hypothetical protein
MNMKEKNTSLVKDIITKFFYKDNQLCFQILIRLPIGSLYFWGEYKDFADYKKNFISLQKAKESGIMVELPEKGGVLDITALKVA